MLTKPNDPWIQTINLLKVFTVRKAESTKIARSVFDTNRPLDRCNLWRDSVSASVRVLERPTPTTATVSWSDSTSGCYGDQVWRLSVARRQGICAVTGETICRGDRVYTPRGVPRYPSNANAMISLSVVHSQSLILRTSTDSFFDPFPNITVDSN
jgi:hypothetical protein